MHVLRAGSKRSDLGLACVTQGWTLEASRAALLMPTTSTTWYHTCISHLRLKSPNQTMACPEQLQAQQPS